MCFVALSIFQALPDPEGPESQTLVLLSDSNKATNKAVHAGRLPL